MYVTFKRLIVIYSILLRFSYNYVYISNTMFGFFFLLLASSHNSFIIRHATCDILEVVKMLSSRLYVIDWQMDHEKLLSLVMYLFNLAVGYSVR